MPERLDSYSGQGKKCLKNSKSLVEKIQIADNTGVGIKKICRFFFDKCLKKISVKNPLRHLCMFLSIFCPFKELTGGRQIHDFAPIATLPVGSAHTTVLGVDLNDSTQPLQFAVATASGRNIQVSLKFPIGEAVRAITMPDTLFDAERGKLKGMNEHTASVPILPG